MANDGRIYDGMTVAIGCDSDTSPSYLPASFTSVAVNRTFRKGTNTTRPPFTELQLQVAFGQDPSILTDFQTGNFQGAIEYQALKSVSVDGIVCSVAGTIYFISIVNNIGTIYKLISGNDPTMMHAWFCQAEDWLYIQNGYQDPIAWNGDITGTPTNLRAQGLITNNIRLTWTNNAPGASGTEIQVQSNGSVFTTVTIVDPTVSTYDFNVTGLNIKSVSRSRTSNVATINTLTAHGLTTGDQIIVENMGNASYNTQAAAATVTSPTSFTYASTGANESLHTDTNGLIGLEAAATSYSFQVRAVFPDGSSTNWSNIATTTAINPTRTAKLPDSCFRLNPSKQQMPIGTIMAYSYGRVWLSDKSNNIYASDIIYGTGFTTTSNTQNFTEQTYWNEGGSFTPPATMGQITGMLVQSSLNTNVYGQGNLVVMCENGAFTLNGSADRTTWSTSSIQNVSMAGLGCRSPWSVVSVNSDVFFRSDNGWSLYNNAQTDFYSTLGIRKISREVNRWCEQDTLWLRQFESAMFFDNRLIATVSPYTVAPPNPATAGLHRPSRAMIVLDLDKTAVSAPDASTPFRWDGLWEGPQPTQLLTAQINNVQRAFAFSYDVDGVNRIYELQRSGGDDYSQSLGNVKIGSFFTTKRFDFAQAGSNPFTKKQIIGGDIWLSNCDEQISVNVDFAPDAYPAWFPILDSIQFGCDYATPIVVDGMPQISQPSYRQIKFPSPQDFACEIPSGQPANEAAEFQLKVELTGSCNVDRLRLSADNSSIDLPAGECAGDDTTPCNMPVDYPPLDDLDFYRIFS